MPSPAKCVLVFIDKSESTRPGPPVFIPYDVASRSLPRLLRALPAQICVWHGRIGHFLVAAPAAHAACRSPKSICKHLDDCLQRTSDPNNKDADDIRAGVKARNGQIVLADAEACARDLGKKQQWDKWARGCSELEFVQIAKVGLELGKVHCDRYSQ